LAIFQKIDGSAISCCDTPPPLSYMGIWAWMPN
jgi:hypothetical protein